MKSQILDSKHLVPGDKVKLELQVSTKEHCVLFVGVVSEDDELYPEFLKRCN